MTASFLEKLWYNKLTTAPIDRFEGECFVLNFPPNWRQVRKLRNLEVADFVNLDEDHGLLQISSFVNESPSYSYDIDKELTALESEGFKPSVESLNDLLKVIIYAVKFEEGTVQYRFEVGSGRYRIFSTLTFENCDDKTKDKYFEEAITILCSLEFKNEPRCTKPKAK
jgi:hypothetical protein